MEIQPECVPCLLKRCRFESKLVDEDKEREVIDRALSILEEHFEDGAVSAEVATKVHREVYDILGTDDPYSEMKKESNETAEKLLPKAEKIVRDGGLKEAFLVAIAGNVMDFGYRDDIGSPEYLLDEFESIVEEGLGYDDTDRIENILENGDEIVFFTDNAGEIVFDTILLEKLKEYDIDLMVVVKGEPILTDATMSEALELDIDKIADELTTTGGYAVGVNFDLISDNLRKKLEDSDLIIAKGMANWEAFSETSYSPIAFLTRSKCRPVSDSMDVPFDSNVAKLFE